MATDYDAPRVKEEDRPSDSLEGLKAQQRGGAMTAVRDVADETDAIDGFELPGADLSGEELIVKVIPRQKDEFICCDCFMVAHRSQAASSTAGGTRCADCEAL